MTLLIKTTRILAVRLSSLLSHIIQSLSTIIKKKTSSFHIYRYLAYLFTGTWGLGITV